MMPLSEKRNRLAASGTVVYIGVGGHWVTQNHSQRRFQQLHLTLTGFSHRSSTTTTQARGTRTHRHTEQRLGGEPNLD